MRKLPQPINKHEFDLLIEEAKSMRDKYDRPRAGLTPRGINYNQYIIAMILAFGAGLRISEMVGFKNKVPKLTKESIENNFIRILSGKGNKDRIVPLPSKLFLQHGIKRQDLLNNLPLKMSRRSIQHYVTKIGFKVLKKKISIHKFRHGFATHLLVNGMPIHQVQMFMGHSRLDTTGVYLHVNPKEAIDKYEEVF